MEITWSGISQEEEGENRGGKVHGIRRITGRHKNRQGEVKNSIGNGESKELICMTHGHELRWRNAGGGGGTV